MITIICGEDIVASRKYFTDLKNEYIKKGYEIQEVVANQISDIDRWMGESIGLFSSKAVFVTQGLNKTISRKVSEKKNIEMLSRNKEVILLDWEESLTGREVKMAKLVTLKEFKLDQSIFKLTDACYPGNLERFCTILESLPAKIEDGFIFFMLVKHLRNLILVKSNQKPARMMDWQIWKLQKQAKYWSSDSLITFYDNLQRIDVRIKTSNNPYSLRRSLDILAYYLL